VLKKGGENTPLPMSGVTRLVSDPVVVSQAHSQRRFVVGDLTAQRHRQVDETVVETSGDDIRRTRQMCRAIIFIAGFCSRACTPGELQKPFACENVFDFPNLNSRLLTSPCEVAVGVYSDCPFVAEIISFHSEVKIESFGGFLGAVA